MAKGTSFKVFIGFFISALFLAAPQVSAAYSGVKITTEVVPGGNDFFIEVSVYRVYNPVDTLNAFNLTEDELPQESFMFYVYNGSSYIVWRGDFSSNFHRAFYSNGSWYLLLQGGYPLLRINGKPFSRSYPYNLTYTSITLYRIKNGCIEPTWVIPTPSRAAFGFARLENGTVILSSYSRVSGEFLVKVHLKSFEEYLRITNASAFADSLEVAKLSNGGVVVFFPELYYFRLNGTVYGGTFKHGTFAPVFEGNVARDYVFIYNGSLDATPTVRVNFDVGGVFPEITAQYSLRTCYQKNSTTISVSKTSTGAGSTNPWLAILSLGIGILIGAVIGYKVSRKWR